MHHLICSASLSTHWVTGRRKKVKWTNEKHESLLQNYCTNIQWSSSTFKLGANDVLSLWAEAAFLGGRALDRRECDTSVNVYKVTWAAVGQRRQRRARAACLKLFQTVEERRKSPRIPAGREWALWSLSDRGSVRTRGRRHTSSPDPLSLSMRPRPHTHSVCVMCVNIVSQRCLLI